MDSVSGIYPGFEDKEDDSETEDADEKAGSDDTNPEDVSLEVKRFKMLGLFKKKKSKYKVSSDIEDMDMEGGRYFKFIRKVRRKAEVCQ